MVAGWPPLPNVEGLEPVEPGGPERAKGQRRQWGQRVGGPERPGWPGRPLGAGGFYVKITHVTNHLLVPRF